MVFAAGDGSLSIRCLILSSAPSSNRTLSSERRRPNEKPGRSPGCTSRARGTYGERPRHARLGRGGRRPVGGCHALLGPGRPRLPLAGRRRPVLVRRADRVAGAVRSAQLDRAAALAGRRGAAARARVGRDRGDGAGRGRAEERFRQRAARPRRRLRDGGRPARHRLGARVRGGVPPPGRETGDVPGRPAAPAVGPGGPRRAAAGADRRLAAGARPLSRPARADAGRLARRRRPDLRRAPGHPRAAGHGRGRLPARPRPLGGEHRRPLRPAARAHPERRPRRRRRDARAARACADHRSPAPARPPSSPPWPWSSPRSWSS